MLLLIGEVALSELDRDYYRKRLEAELALAGKAKNKSVAAVHLTMALEYEERMSDLRKRPALKIVGPN